MGEIEEMHLRALAGYEKTQGLEHYQTLDTRYNLALLYATQSLFEDATKDFQLALQICTKTLGPEHPKTIEV